MSHSVPFGVTFLCPDSSSVASSRLKLIDFSSLLDCTILALLFDTTQRRRNTMAATHQQLPTAGAGPVGQYDVIILGAGLTGLYQLYRIRQLGLSVPVFEDGGGVGCT